MNHRVFHESLILLLSNKDSYERYKLTKNSFLVTERVQSKKEF